MKSSYTKEQFKALWDSNDEYGGITYKDITDCAIAWGLYKCPTTHNIHEVTKDVCVAAECRNIPQYLLDLKD